MVSPAYRVMIQEIQLKSVPANRRSSISQINPATSAAADRQDKPRKYRLSTTPILVLKRARRNAAPAQYTNAASQPHLPKPRRDHSLTTRAGAAPKETM